MREIYLANKLQKCEVHFDLEAATWCQHSHILERGHGIHPSTRIHRVLSQQIHQNLGQAQKPNEKTKKRSTIGEPHGWWVAKVLVGQLALFTSLSAVTESA